MAGPAVNVRLVGIDQLRIQYAALGNGVFRDVVRKAVNIMASDYNREITRQLPAIFDRPAPFTKRAVNSDSSKKGDTKIQSRVYIRPKQADYLLIQETGGDRRRGKSHGKSLIPLGIADQSVTDRYGGLGPSGIKNRVSLNQARGKGRNRSKFGPPTPNGKRNASRPGTRTLFVATLKTAKGEIQGLWVREKQKGAEIGAATAKRNGASNMGPPTKKQKRGGRGYIGPSTVKKKDRKGNPRWKTRLLVAFREEAHYDPIFEFGERAGAYASPKFVPLVQRLLRAELNRRIKF